MDQRNLILAIVLSVSILLGFQIFIEGPRIEEQRALLEAQKAQETAQATNPAAPGQGAAPVPGQSNGGVPGQAIVPTPGAVPPGAGAPVAGQPAARAAFRAAPSSPPTRASGLQPAGLSDRSG